MTTPTINYYCPPSTMLSHPWNWLAIACAIFVFTCPMAESYPREDKIQSLPGQPPVTFQQFAGYITIDDRKQRSMFYYFVEAETKPTSKPLVLWLNGGPGCSSLIGAFLEHGPFVVSAKGIVKNKYSWSRVADMLYLESPAGVGFPYSVNASIYASYNDEIIARDNLAFLQRWFAEFPEYKNREFFITGESSGGHYVPQVAQLIIQTKAIPNLKGIAIGNPLLEFENDFNSKVDYYWSHGLISDSTCNAMNRVCKGSEYVRQLIRGKISDTCKKLYGSVETAFAHSVDQNNILGQTCKSLNSSMAAILAHPPTPIMSQLLPPYTNKRQGDDGVCEPGLMHLSNYLNRKDVQTALHAQLVGANRWAYCNKPINTNYSVASWEIPTIKVLGWLVKLGIRVVVYSGDQDAKIPFIGTRRLVRELAEELKLKVTTEYTPWFVGEKLQVGGWIEEYGKWLSYVVIRGASHVAPATQPKRAFMLFDAFLQGKLLPIPQH